MGIPNFCRGDVNAIPAPFTTGSVFALGEVCALVSNKAIPASAFTWDTDLATTRTNFVAALLGVSLQQHLSTTSGSVYGNGTDNRIMLGTTGEYWFAVSGTAAAFGDWVCLAKNPSSNALLPATVEKVTTEATAIGRCVEVVSASLVIVRLKQVVIPGV